jgi:hypothetical protein
VKTEAIDMPLAGAIESLEKSRFFPLYLAAGAANRGRCRRFRIRIVHPAQTPAQLLCGAQVLSESQILNAGPGPERCEAVKLTLCDLYSFRAARAWHEA